MTDRLKLSDAKGDAEAAKIASALELAENKRRIKELQKNIADLENIAEQKDQLERKTAQSNNNIGARKNASLKAVSSAPSINLTPRGRGMVPVAYPTVQDLSTSTGVAKTVRFNGDPVYLYDSSTQPACKGDEQGSGGGIRSGTVNGVVKPVKGSSTVNVEKKPVIRAGDPCTMNGGNNPGVYVTAPAPTPAPPKFAIETSNPPITFDTPEEQSAFGKWLDKTAEDISQALEHPLEGVKGAAKGLVNTVPATVELLLKAAAEQHASELEDAARTQTLFGQGDAVKSLSDVADATRVHAAMIDVPKLTMTNPAQEGGDTISTVAQIFAGGVGLLRSGATWLAGLSKTGKAVEAAKAATAGKVVEATGVSGAEKVVILELVEVWSAETGVKILGKSGASKNGPVLSGENTSLYSRTGQSTGVAEFDQLFSLSAQFEKMTAALERRGVIVIDDASRLDPTASAQVFRENGKLTLIYDSKTTPFVDMLHEARHVAQIQRAEASGAIGSKDIFGNSRLLGAAERGAYEYELRLGTSRGFSSDYMNFLNNQIDHYYPSSYAMKFNASPTMRRIFNAMEPALKP